MKTYPQYFPLSHNKNIFFIVYVTHKKYVSTFPHP